MTFGRYRSASREQPARRLKIDTAFSTTAPRAAKMRSVEEVVEHQLRWRRAAAYVVCQDDQGRILLTRFYAENHPDSGRWTMPGGAMEWGETPEQTALRELEEETGLRARLESVVRRLLALVHSAGVRAW